MTPEVTTGTAAEQQGAIESLIGSSSIAFVLQVVLAIGVVIFLTMVSKVIAALVRSRVYYYAKERDKKHVEQIARLIHDMVFYSLITFAFFVGFEIMGFDVALILWWISLWLWLAFKEVLGNMIAGIMLLTNKEIHLGDIVQIDLDATTSYFGRIEEINLRYTVLRTFDLKQVILPNMVLINASIQTYSTEEIVRLETIVQVHYDTDLEYAIRVFTEWVNSCPYVTNPEKTMVITQNLWESGIDMKCLFYIDPNAGLLIEQIIGLINERLTNYARANGIRIPYPHTTLTIDTKNAANFLAGINQLIMKQDISPARSKKITQQQELPPQTPPTS